MWENPQKVQRKVKDLASTTEANSAAAWHVCSFICWHCSCLGRKGANLILSGKNILKNITPGTGLKTEGCLANVFSWNISFFQCVRHHSRLCGDVGPPPRLSEFPSLHTHVTLQCSALLDDGPSFKWYAREWWTRRTYKKIHALNEFPKNN